MSSFLKNIKKLILGEKEVDEITTSLEQLNKVTSSYISVLQEQLKQKENKVNSIRVLVNRLPRNFKRETPNIDITVLDIKKRNLFKKKNENSTEKMDWQNELDQFRKKRRGKII